MLKIFYEHLYINIYIFCLSQEPSWPTPSGITEHRAKRYCIKYIMRSTVGRMCNKVVPEKLESILASCMTDIKV